MRKWLHCSCVDCHGGQLRICNETQRCEGANFTNEQVNLEVPKPSAPHISMAGARTSEGRAGGGGGGKHGGAVALTCRWCWCVAC